MVNVTSSRLFRCLVCLALVCCVLVSASPIRVHATAVTAAGAVVGLTPTAAVAGILACLGVFYNGSTGFVELCKNIATTLPSDYLAAGTAINLVEGLLIDSVTYVSEELVRYVSTKVATRLDRNTACPLQTEAALPFLKLITEYRNFPALQPYIFDYAKATYISFNDGYNVLVLHNSEVTYQNYTDNSTYTFPFPCMRFTGTVDYASGPNYVGLISGGQETSLSGQTSRTIDRHSGIANILTVPVTEALFVPYFSAAPDLDDDEEYQAWKARRQFRIIEGGDGGEDPDGDGDDDEGLRVLAPYFPVPAAENVENLPNTIDKAWAGTRSWEDPDDDPVTDLNQSVEVTPDLDYSPAPDPAPDTDPSPEPDPQPDPDPAPDPAPDPQPSQALAGTSLEPFVLPSLRNFFPFCIPFDLYDMLAAFVAEPEAPVFTFATGFLDNVFTVDIDLSPWNSIAKTVRAIQLCICIVGLAFATRKFIKW